MILDTGHVCQCRLWPDDEVEAFAVRISNLNPADQLFAVLLALEDGRIDVARARELLERAP